MQRLFKVLIIGFMLLVGVQGVQAKEQNIWLVWGDELIVLEEGNIFEEKGTTYIPLREIGELFDAEILWSAQTDKIQIISQDKNVHIDTKNKLYTVEEDIDKIPVPLQIVEKHQRTYIPLRTFADIFNYPIDYISEGPFVRIQTPESVLTNQEICEQYKDVIEEQKDIIYLTFDDGPNQYTEAILDLLKAYDMQATFFMLEGNMRRYPHLVKRMVDEGHSVALHGVTHDKDRFYNGAYGPYNEFEKGNKALKDISGIRTNIVRMPYGSVPYLTNAQLDILEQSGYQIWDWHVDSRDWANRNGYTTYTQVVNQLSKVTVEEPIVLFHESKYTVETVKKLLVWMDDNNQVSIGLTDEMNGLNFKEKNLYK